MEIFWIILNSFGNIQYAQQHWHWHNTVLLAAVDMMKVITDEADDDVEGVEECCDAGVNWDIHVKLGTLCSLCCTIIWINSYICIFMWSQNITVLQPASCMLCNDSCELGG